MPEGATAALGLGAQCLPARGEWARLAAGGSLDAGTAGADLGTLRRAWLWFELVALFVGAPLAMAWAIYTWWVPLFLVLQPVLITIALLLLADRTFRLRTELGSGFSLATAASILAVFVLLGAIITALTWWVYPRQFLGFPRSNPRVWAMVMVLYPLLSVIAQELVYRTFFFHRYGALFGRRKWVAILLNGALFGFGHILFGNLIAVAGTAVIGALLAWRYVETRSFWAVWLEHSLYGALIFTIGLGRFFFTGVSNVN